jgi:assimilatory nitrate reductase catalytic subunit
MGPVASSSIDTVSTHCPYCALQCGMHITGTPGAVEIAGDTHFPVNKGGLCIKGWTSAEALSHPERLRHPLVRSANGTLEEATWDAALDSVVARIKAAQDAGGADAVGVFGGGSLTNEKAYWLGKFARVALGTSRIDYNGRFCMSSAAAASTKAFGIDRGLPFPLSDIADASVVLLVGANVAETMPPIMQYFEAQQARGGTLVVVDPRQTATAQWAGRHLALRPGTDAALANGLLHVLVRDGLIDRAYIDARTEGFDDVRRVAASYWPERVEETTGVPAAAIVDTARLLGRAARPMVLTARGPEQQSQGVNNALAYINVALALGAVGKAGAGYGCLTGQGNGQGGREHGQKADQLPGYRRIDDLEARRRVASVWGVPEESIPGAGVSAFELLDSIGTPGGVRALFVTGSNPAVSAPDSVRVNARLRALDSLIVSDFFLSETAAMADVVLPAAQWAEEAGTMTNLEGRVILRRAAFAPPAAVRTDLDIISALAARLGHARRFPTADPRVVFDELRRATAGAPADYSGITYERLEQGDGIFWPCPSASHPGTPRMFAATFSTRNGRARFHPTPVSAPAEERSRDFPLFLTTGRVLAHYQSGTQTRRIERLKEAASEPFVEIHPRTATRLQLTDGQLVELATRRGRARFRLKVTAGVREDTVFAPFHWSGEQSANRLTNAALDPTSRMPEFKVCAVRIDALSADGAAQRERP